MSKIEEEDLRLSSHYSSPMSNIVTSLLVTTTGDEGEKRIMYICIYIYYIYIYYIYIYITYIHRYIYYIDIYITYIYIYIYIKL